MSRIQEILSKAERDGTARRTRTLGEAGAASAGVAPPPAPRVELPEPPREPVRHAAPPPPWVRPAETPEPDLQEYAPAGGLPVDERLVAALAPHSFAAEQYRSLRTRIKRAEGSRAVRVIVVTSPAKGDGKSLTAANLALTMAQEFQQRVLLVDADLRRPTVHGLFGVAEGPGLSDVLVGAAELDRALVALPDYNLTVLPAGAPPHHPAELLGSASMRRLFDSLKTRFDRVLVDMPPVEPLADLHIVAPMAEGILMIVRAGVTPRPAIERALAGLDGSKVLGLVLNEAGAEGADDGSYGGYGYIG